MDMEQDNNILSDGLPRILPAYENGVFQALLTLPEAHAALEGLVAAVIEQPVKSVVLRNNSAPSRDISAKQEQYDINCAVDMENGDQFNIEMQASPMAGDNLGNEHRNIKWRSVFNLCDLHSNQEGRGLKYGQFARSYQVMLCNYSVFSEEHELVERFTFRNPEGKELCDAVTAIFIDLLYAKKIAKKPVSEMSRIEQWTVFFAFADKPDYSEIIAEITKQQEGIAVAKETLLSLSRNPDERARFRSRRIWLQDREHEQAVWLEEGREESRAEYEPLLALKDAEIADKDAEIADKDAEIADKDAEIAGKDVEIANKDAEIAALRALLGKEQ